MASERPSLDALRIDRSEVKESGGRGRLWLALLVLVLVPVAAGWWFTRLGKRGRHPTEADPGRSGTPCHQTHLLP